MNSISQEKGIVTVGDLKRWLESIEPLNGIPVDDAVVELGVSELRLSKASPTHYVLVMTPLR